MIVFTYTLNNNVNAIAKFDITYGVIRCDLRVENNPRIVVDFGLSDLQATLPVSVSDVSKALELALKKLGVTESELGKKQVFEY